MNDERRWSDSIKLLRAEIIQLDKCHVWPGRADNKVLARHHGFPAGQLMLPPYRRGAHHRGQLPVEFSRSVPLTPDDMLLDIRFRDDEIARTDTGEQIKHYMPLTPLCAPAIQARAPFGEKTIEYGLIGMVPICLPVATFITATEPP